MCRTLINSLLKNNFITRMEGPALDAALTRHNQAKRTPLLAVVTTLLLLLLPLARASAEPVTLNLKNADIGALINTVAEATGKNFVVDPRVKGTVTVISAHPMEKDELYQVFLSILEVHGYAAVPSGEVIKIVPDVKAKQGGFPEPRGASPRGDEVVTQVIKVNNVTAAQLVPVLRPLVPQEGHLAAYPESNVLVISDRASNVARLAQIIARIDQPTNNDIDVIRLEHASAAELVRTLDSLEKRQGPGQQPPTQRVRLIADERTNSILLSGDKNERLRLRAIITHLDTPLESGGNTQVIYLRYAKAKDLVPVLTGVTGSIQAKSPNKGGPPGAPPGGVSIQADDTANALVITAPADTMRSLRSVVRQLDVRRAQVLVEAIIAEISVDKTRQLGVQWLLDGTPGSGGTIGTTNFSAGKSSILDAASALKQGNVPNVGDGLSIGIGRFNKAGISYGALIQALANDANSNILSTPSLMTLDNQEAEIVVGQTVPFVTGQYTNTGTTTNSVNPFQTIQREDVGLTLKVTPQINEGDAVKLDIEQIVSSLSPTSTPGAADLITNKRSIKTTVMVEDGHTVVLGGLIDDQLQQTKEKIPLLGDVPLLGRMFRYDKTNKVKRNLVVFLRPIILRDPATAARILDSKYSYVREQQLMSREHGVQLLDKSAVPVLPADLTHGHLPYEDNQKPAPTKAPSQSAPPKLKDKAPSDSRRTGTRDEFAFFDDISN